MTGCEYQSVDRVPSESRCPDQATTRLANVHDTQLLCTAHAQEIVNYWFSLIRSQEQVTLRLTQLPGVHRRNRG